MLLTDIAITHTYKSRKGGAGQSFLMHPFENSQGADTGMYEIIRNMNPVGEPKMKRSTHVTIDQLAEIYARGMIETFGIRLRLRLRPATGTYPAAPPGKRVLSNCILPGSNFDRLVKGVDTSRPISSALLRQLVKFEVSCP